MQTIRVQLVLSDTEEYLGNDPAVLLGSCCVTGKLEHDCIEPVINDAEQIVLASTKCRFIYQDVLPILAARINQELGVNITNRGYRLILGNWLRNFIEAIYERYVNLEKAIELFPDFYVSNPTPVTPILVEDYPDFQKHLQTPVYNRLLLLQILRGIVPESDQGPLRSTQRDVHIQKNTWSRRDWVVHWLHRFRTKFSGRYVLISNATLPYFTKLGILRFLIQGGSTFAVDNLKFSLDCTLPVRNTFRNSPLALPDPGAATAFKKIICALVPANLPMLFLEGLPAMIEQTQKYNAEKIAAVYTNFGIHNNTLLKVMLATNEGKFPLLCHQHGGRYCIDEVHFPFEYEKEVANEMLLWGDDDRGTYMPSLKLKTRSTTKGGQKGLLLGVTGYNRYHQRYILKPQAGPYELSKYHSDTALFLSLLNPSISLTIRPPAGFGYDFSYLQRKVRYDLSDQSFESVLPSYALYCVDHLGTTMLESISMGIPTIVILDKRFVKYHGEAQKIMASLESIGVIHYSPKTAAAFVNDNFLTIDRWWQSAPVQASLQNFIQRFARASDEPKARLIHYLRSFLS